MCGLSGYVGITDRLARLTLAYGLGYGIDRRGGHAAGFVSAGEGVNGARITRRVGTWTDAPNKFFRRASAGSTCMMHARFATCGKRDAINHAHPFTIRRDGKDVLYGAHNGVVQGTSGSAKEHGREYSVDSKEVYELLADGKLDVLQELEGYGVLTWLTPGSDAINVARLSNRSDFVATTVEGGGVVWASTETILYEALKVAGLKASNLLSLPDIGTVYQLSAGGVLTTATTGVHVAEPKPYVGANSTYDYSGEWWNRPGSMSDYGANWEALAERRKAREESYAKWAKESADRRNEYLARHTPTVGAAASKDKASAVASRVAGRREDGTFAPFRGTDGTMWIHNGHHWAKEPKPVVSDLASAQTQEGPAVEPKVALCAHYTSLYAYCNHCGPGRWHAGKRVEYQPIGSDMPSQASNGDTQPRIRVATAEESAGKWPMSAKTEPRFRDGKLPEWDTMSDAEIDSITDEEWDLISDAYIGERTTR